MTVSRGFNDVFGFGGDDIIRLVTQGDLGGNNFVDAGSGKDGVVNMFEGGNEIFLGTGNDTYVGLGFGLGGTGDIVRAGSGDDLLAVTTLHSAYFGDSGNDTFVSVGFRNGFNGGSGIDTISYEARSDDPTIGNTGVDIRLNEGKVFTGASRFETLVSIENARGSANADTIVGTGGANTLEGLGGNDVISGGGGADILDGGAGDDILDGGSSKDILKGGSGKDQLFGGTNVDNLYGGSGQDVLNGGSNNDILRGGTGKDLLTGGTGRDTFVFKSVAEASSSPKASARDVITDFTSGQDKIDLSAIDANSVSSGNQAFSFRSAEGADFTGAKGQLIWDQFGSGSTARTIIQGDINGDKVADFQIELTGHIDLSASDFIL
ncbi:MAG: M10 family metallopeptidase C-terminal domain-containing protein [Devosia sp.]|nr:MAG: M10 family metallopeptidase C-terminal domain-containing protein [Devosia sp.]